MKITIMHGKPTISNGGMDSAKILKNFEKYFLILYKNYVIIGVGFRHEPKKHI